MKSAAPTASPSLNGRDSTRSSCGPTGSSPGAPPGTSATCPSSVLHRPRYGLLPWAGMRNARFGERRVARRRCRLGAGGRQRTPGRLLRCMHVLGRPADAQLRHPTVRHPSQEALDRAVLAYREQAASRCVSLVYTQGGFLADSLPCWTDGDANPELKPNVLLALRVPNEDWVRSPPNRAIGWFDSHFRRWQERAVLLGCDRPVPRPPHARPGSAGHGSRIHVDSDIH